MIDSENKGDAGEKTGVENEDRLAEEAAAMSDESREEQVEELPEDEPVEELSLESLLEEREALCKERDELFDKLQRSAADYQNFRRRSQAQLEDQIRFRMENLFQDIITVLDSMDAAFLGAEATTENSSARAVLEGFDQIRNLLRSTMDRNGLTRIPTKGEAFDPRLHEVLFTEESDAVAPDTVLEELRAGYLLRDRVLRPAQVKVSKPKAEQPGEEQPSGEGESDD